MDLEPLSEFVNFSPLTDALVDEAFYASMRHVDGYWHTVIVSAMRFDLEAKYGIGGIASAISEELEFLS